MNCPGVGPFHGVNSFRNRLLQHGCPTGSEVLPANLLRCGLSTGLQVLAGACSSIGFRGHSFLQAYSCSSVGSSIGCRWISAPLCTSMGCRGQPASPWSSPQAAGESLLRRLEHLLPPPSALTLVSAELLLSQSHSSLQLQLLLHRFFLPFLKYVITEVLPPLLIGLALASNGSILELAGTGSVRHMGSF